MATSNEYTTRWPVVETLKEFIYESQNEEDKTFLMRYKFCNQLRQDSHPLVAAEAEYEYQILELKRRKYKEDISKSEYKKQRKELKKLEPFLFFSDISVQFSNYMYTQKLYTYNIEELDNFIDKKQVNMS